MRLLISSEAGVQAGAEYLRVIGFVYFVQSQSLIQAAVLKSTEQVKLPMFASLAAICTNVVFNTLLIYPTRQAQLLGLTFTMPGAGMGVRGGAIATLIGACVELFLILFFSYRWRFANAARPRELLPGSVRAVRGFVAIALPVLLNEAVWACGTVMYSAVYGRIGDGVAASAAAGVFSNVEQLANIAVRALSHACGVMVGMALGARMEHLPSTIFTCIGDGESQEGQVWEAAMLAASQRLGNLIAFTDYNKMQIDGYIEDINGLYPLADKWESFGWHVQSVDGHDVSQIAHAIDCARLITGRPSMILLNTIKGKGCCFCENKLSSHSVKNITEEMWQKAVALLDGRDA